MIQYLIKRRRDKYYIYDNGTLLLSAFVRDGWLTKQTVLIFENEEIVLHTESKKLFNYTIKIKKCSFRDISSSDINVVISKQHVNLIVKNDIFSISEFRFINPIRYLFLNGLEIGQIHPLKKKRLGLDTEFNLLFHENSKLNYFAMVTFFLNLNDMMG